MKKFVLIFPFFLLGSCVSHEERIRMHNEMIQSIENEYAGLDVGMLEFERELLSYMLEKEERVNRGRSSSNFISGVILLAAEGSTKQLFAGDEENRRALELRENREHRLEAINNLLSKRQQKKPALSASTSKTLRQQRKSTLSAPASKTSRQQRKSSLSASTSKTSSRQRKLISSTPAAKTSGIKSR